jgi:mRNA interferase RelE/StbE
MTERIAIRWTDTARDGLAKLPKKVRRGLLDKANALQDADDPTAANKRLTGPLAGYFRICYARYRAIYSVERETFSDGSMRHQVTVLFVAVGVRKEGDKNDIYRFAQRLLRLGIIRPAGEQEGESK